MKKYILRLFFIIPIIFSVIVFTAFAGGQIKVFAQMPFYDLKPQNLVLRSTFYTSYPSSSEERKENIMLASRSLDNTFVDVGGEFSFNEIVGDRTTARGYKNAKIIVNGSFVDGVGGGVCQVSTTLYNAVLLAGLRITEYHPHSLPVSYVSPSFDAMVSSGSADFRFVNNTHNPVLIKTQADRSQIKIYIYGEPSPIKYVRKSVVTEELLPPSEEIVIDDTNEFPDLSLGERRVLSYSKAGYKSEGYIIALKNGKPVSSTKIRSDVYGGVRGKIVEGRGIIVRLPDQNMGGNDNEFGGEISDSLTETEN